MPSWQWEIGLLRPIGKDAPLGGKPAWEVSWRSPGILLEVPLGNDHGGSWWAPTSWSGPATLAEAGDLPRKCLSKLFTQFWLHPRDAGSHHRVLMAAGRENVSDSPVFYFHEAGDLFFPLDRLVSFAQSCLTAFLETEVATDRKEQRRTSPQGIRRFCAGTEQGYEVFGAHGGRESVNFLSRVWLFEMPWTVACQAPLSVEFSRPEYWSGMPVPYPGESSRPRD